MILLFSVFLVGRGGGGKAVWGFFSKNSSKFLNPVLPYFECKMPSNRPLSKRIECCTCIGLFLQTHYSTSIDEPDNDYMMN